MLINFNIKPNSIFLLVYLELVLVVEVFQELDLVKFDKHLQLLLIHFGLHHLQILFLCFQCSKLSLEIGVELICEILLDLQIILQNK